MTFETKRYTDRIVYFVNNEAHRPNGPAVVLDDGSWGWCLRGRWHRYYGPQCSDNLSLWYLEGKALL